MLSDKKDNGVEITIKAPGQATITTFIPEETWQSALAGRNGDAAPARIAKIFDDVAATREESLKDPRDRLMDYQESTKGLQADLVTLWEEAEGSKYPRPERGNPAMAVERMQVRRSARDTWLTALHERTEKRLAMETEKKR